MASISILLSLIALFTFVSPSFTQNKIPDISFDVKISNNPFLENHNKSFSWTDPRLQQRLWAGREHELGLAKHRMSLQKRAPKVYGPAIKTPNCVGCAAAPGGAGCGPCLLANLNTPYMVTRMLLRSPSLQSRCVFYTSRNVQYQTTRDPNLSKIACGWAQSKGFISIWVRLPAIVK
jgi:hypothetical protein